MATQNSALSELKNNTEILEMTFENAGLQVIQKTWKAETGIDQLILYIEVTGDPQKIKEDYLTIKVNLYDAEGEILSMKYSTIATCGFSGYETKAISFYEKGIRMKAKKARVFAVRGYDT